MEKQLKIMLLEDREEDAELIERCLRRADLMFETLRVDTREEFIEGLEAFKPDVILSDHSLPQFNSIEALKIYKKVNPKLPFILVTGTVSEEFAVNCLKEGADDYILKSNLVRLPNAIKNAIQNRWYENNRQQQKETLELQNYQLLKVNSELDKFVYSISHSLRAPLSTVLGLTHIVSQESEQDVQAIKGYFEMIEKCITGLDNTIRNILHYSQNFKTDIEIQEINLRKLLQEIVDETEGQYKVGKVNKHIEIKNQEFIHSDSYRLGIILTNLISNAFVFAKTDEPFIGIEAAVHPGYVVIHVKDNGAGIPENQKEKIFDMFYRASYKSRGEGLGLYIVKEMVEKLKGSISFESILGIGTDFKLCIPNNVTG